PPGRQPGERPAVPRHGPQFRRGRSQRRRPLRARAASPRTRQMSRTTLDAATPGGGRTSRRHVIPDKGSFMKRTVLATGLVVAASLAVLAALAGGRASSRPAALPLPRPTVSDYVQLTTSETPPTQEQCNSAGRRCFTPQSTRASYDLNPLYANG